MCRNTSASGSSFPSPKAVLADIENNVDNLAPRAPTARQTERAAEAISYEVWRLLIVLDKNPFAASRLPDIGPQLEALKAAAENLRALAAAAGEFYGPPSLDMFARQDALLHGMGLRQTPPNRERSAALEGLLADLAVTWKEFTGAPPPISASGPFVELVAICRDNVSHLDLKDSSIKEFCDKANEALGLWVKAELSRAKRSPQK
jgi:hypothetical protein